MGRKRVRLWNLLTRLRRNRCRPEHLLLIFPACLQNSRCPQKITNGLSECKRCGKCKVNDLIGLAEQYGTLCGVATGGHLALQQVKQNDVEAVVAVACEKEIREGMKGTFPKPALGIVNLRPNGPCRDTDVDLAEVEEAVRWFLGKK